MATQVGLKLEKNGVNNFTISAILVGFGLMISTGDVFAVITVFVSVIFLIRNGLNFKITWGFLLIAQYLLVQLILSAYHQGFQPLTSDQINYIFVLAMLVPIANLVQSIRPSYKFFENLVFIGLSCSMGLMLLDYYTDVLGLDSQCRVAVFSINPLMPATGIMMVFFPLLASSVDQTGKLSFFQGALLAAVIVSVSALTGARMAFYAAILILIILAILLLKRSYFQTVLKISAFSAVGFVAMLAIDIQSGCGFSSRITQQIGNYSKVVDMISSDSKPVITPDPQGASQTNPTPITQDSDQVVKIDDLSLVNPDLDAVMKSGGSRIVLWKVAFAAIVEKPLLGYGFAEEKNLINTYAPETGQGHVHNQFLSWMIWGGVIGLASGLLLLAAPLFVLQNKLAGAVFAIGWTTVLIADSFLLEPMILAWYIFGVLIFAQLPKIKLGSSHLTE